MATKFILLALVFVVASSAVQSSTLYGFTVQDTTTKTCADTVCVPSQGECFAIGSTAKFQCISTETQNDTLTGCTCRRPDQWFALGAKCDPDARYNQCGALQSQMENPICGAAANSNEWRCYGTKTIGDSCSSAYECMPPRICGSSGKCDANLAVGATCSNSSGTLGICPLNQWCRPAADYDTSFMSTCTDHTALGAACDLNFNNECVYGTHCGLYSASSPTCDAVKVGSVASGTNAGLMEYHILGLGPVMCASGLMNTTSKICLDYDASLAQWHSTFDSLTSSSCFVDEDCNLPGVSQLGICECGVALTGNTAHCVVNPLTPAMKLEAFRIQDAADGVHANGVKAGCESPIPNTEAAFSDATYCAHNYVNSIKTTLCAARAAELASSYQCTRNVEWDSFCGTTPSGDSTGSSSSTSTGTTITDRINGASSTTSISLFQTTIVAITIAAVAYTQ
jgi:hypothetical protein